MTKNSETQTDWKKRFWEYYEGRKEKDGYINPSFLLLFIAEELADARREVITTKIDRLKLYEVIENIYLSGLYSHDKGVLHQYMSDIINVLATLKEEQI